MPSPRPKKKTRQRRNKGTGAFFWSDARKVYIARVQVGRNEKNKPIYTERSDPTEAGLASKIANLKPPEPDTTVREWLTRWLEEMEVRKGTEKIRRRAVNLYFVPTLGHLKVRELTAQQINRASATWAESLAPVTVRMHLAVLHTAMKAAQAAGLRPDNPSASAKRPAVPKKKINPFTRDELNRIIAESFKLSTERPIGLLAALGCRIGEALALDVTSFNPATGYVTITETQDHDRERGPTKSANGVRTVDAPSDVVPLIMAAIGDRTEGPLFKTNRTHQRTTHDNVREAWIRLLKRLGIPFRNLHQLRHTVATLYLAKGYNLGDVAAHLGDSPDTIMRTYCHPTGIKMGAAMHAVLHG